MGQDVILGIRPTDLRRIGPLERPADRVRPDLVEARRCHDASSINAPRVQTDATRAAIEAASDDDATLLADDQRARRFCRRSAAGVPSRWATISSSPSTTRICISSTP